MQVMVEIADIKDRESLQEWLEGQIEEVSMWVTRRAALRVLPNYQQWLQSPFLGQGSDYTVMPILRFYLLSEVSRTMPTRENRARLTTAVNVAAVSSNTSDDAFADVAVATVIRGAAQSAERRSFEAPEIEVRVAASYAAKVADAVVKVVADANELVWSTIRQDCEAVADARPRGFSSLPLDQLPLWYDQQNPLQQEWDNLKAKLGDGFWVRWYDSILVGNPLDGDMLQEIAEIADEEWAKGEARVSFLIGEIEQKYALKATPYPEALTYDTEYKTQPLSSLPAATLQDARDRIADVARGMREGGNQYAALTDEADLLEAYLHKYSDRAIRLFEVCHKVTGHVAAHVANGVLPENDNLIGDVLGDLQNSADDIYNFDADVRQTVDARAKLRLAALDKVQHQQVEQFAEAVAQNAEAGLAAEIREDAAEVMGEVDPEGESKPARYRLGSRLVRVLAMGGVGLAAVLASLAAVEPAIGGAQYLWMIIRPFIGF